MTIDQLTILFFASILYLIWYYIYRKALIELYRGSMYELRSELFFYVVDNNKEFNTVHYRTSEKIINSAIQYVETVGIIKFFVVNKLMTRRMQQVKEVSKKVTEIYENIESESEKVFYSDLMKRANNYSGLYLFLSNPFTFLPFFIVLSFMILYLLCKKILRISSTQVKTSLVGLSERMHVDNLGRELNIEANNQFAV